MIYKNIDLEKLMQLMEKYETAEIRLRDGKTSIEVKRAVRPLGEALETSQAAPQSLKETQPTSNSHNAQTPPEAAQEERVDDENKEENPTINANIKEIIAPLVGTFYRAPAPEASPFVEIGDEVKVGDTLCIVEAMKNMNEIESDIDGTITEICVQNSELVEYGQVLFKLNVAG